MTYQPERHVYLAAPFFNDTQRNVCSFIERHERDTLPIYSPRIDGGVLTPDATNEQREAIFTSNTDAIDDASWVLAVIDDFDSGVIWEMGYAWGQAVPTLGYSDVPGRGLNVMLAGSCSLGFVNGRNELGALLRSGDPSEWFPRNTWRGEIQ